MNMKLQGVRRKRQRCYRHSLPTKQLRLIHLAKLDIQPNQQILPITPSRVMQEHPLSAQLVYKWRDLHNLLKTKSS